MRIDKLTKSAAGKLARISARVTWEERDWPSHELYAEVPAALENDLSCNPNAFLLATAIPAMHRNERRISVEGTLCPQLRDGVTTAMQILRRWFGTKRHEPVIIEATGGFAADPPHGAARTALLLSGGVDALTALRVNRRDFPRGHPRAVADGIFAVGMALGAPAAPLEPAEEIELDSAFLSELIESEGLSLLPVRTNLWSLYEDAWRFAYEGGGAHMAALAHLFPGRYSTAIISSTYPIADLFPWGTHPFLDPNYSSVAVSIRHEGCTMTRLEKVGLIADWSVALRCLRSCHYRPGAHLNCGKCDKCVRTMLELLIHGALENCTTFARREVTPAMIRDMEFLSPPGFLPNLVAPLERIGRSDLAVALRSRVRLEKSKADQAKLRKTVRGLVRQGDRRYLGGTLRRLYRRVKAFRPR